MAVYVVSYELRNTSLDYRNLFEELERSAGWWHYLDNTWLVSTDESATQLYNRLAPYLDGGDSLLIVQAGRDVQGWLPDDAWKWIERELVGVAREVVSKNPDVGAFLLECTELPPYAWAIQKAVRLPVFDFTSLINWVYNAVVRRPFAGYV